MAAPPRHPLGAEAFVWSSLGVALLVGVGDGESVGVGVSVGVGDSVAVGELVGVGVGVGVTTATGVGVGAALEVGAVGLGVRRGELVCWAGDGWSCTSLVSTGTCDVPAGNTRDRAVRDDGDGEELGVSRTVATCWRSTGRCGGPTISPAT